jgi:hypothetical protein
MPRHKIRTNPISVSRGIARHSVTRFHCSCKQAFMYTEAISAWLPEVQRLCPGEWLHAGNLSFFAFLKTFTISHTCTYMCYPSFAILRFRNWDLNRTPGRRVSVVPWWDEHASILYNVSDSIRVATSILATTRSSLLPTNEIWTILPGGVF